MPRAAGFDHVLAGKLELTLEQQQGGRAI